MRLPFLLTSAALAAAPASAQFLLVVESSNDTVMRLSALDGSVIDPVFIDLNLAMPSPSTPIECIRVGDEWWISDQVADTIFRFSLSGTTFLGTVGVGRDNMRGIGLAANGKVYVSNSGTSGAGYGDVVKEYSASGTLDNVFPVGDPFDVVDHCGSLLVADIGGEDIERYAYDGTFLGVFHDAGTLNFPEQISIRKNGNVLVGGFSSPAGIYEYDWQGNEINYWAAGTGLRGVQELGNGKILFTNGSGVHAFDPVGGTVDTIVGGISGRFITLADLEIGTSYCTSTPNSTGDPALIRATGSNSVAANDVQLSSSPVPNQPGVFFHGTVPNQIPFGNGFLCATGTLVRLGVVFGAGNLAIDSADTGVHGFAPGSSSYFQYWYRDPGGGGANFNLSNGRCIHWRP